MITNNRNSTATQHVTFPEGSRVTQYPVEHIGDFLKMFGVNHGWGETEKENVVSTGQDLTMTEWEFITPRRLIFIIVRSGSITLYRLGFHHLTYIDFGNRCLKMGINFHHSA